jgi:hypothetical protein
MPTYEPLPLFLRDFGRLTPAQRAAFLAAVEKFVDGLRRGQPRPGLRVKGVRTAPGVFELTWAPDGRATFEYGDEVRPGHVHVIWRRVGTHAILDEP